MTVWNAHAEYRPPQQLAVEPPATEAREQSWQSEQPIDDFDLIFTTAKQGEAVRAPRAHVSWLVSLHGKALFVSECQPFVRWFIENNPGAVLEDCTHDKASALARTGVTE